MKLFFIVLLVCFFSSFALANDNCSGTESSYTCHDQASGNIYEITKYLGTTYLKARNPRTGSTWSQQSYEYLGTEYIKGVDAQGRSWSQQSYEYLGTRYIKGVDAQGRSWSQQISKSPFNNNILIYSGVTAEGKSYRYECQNNECNNK